jgi:hypothetical protein
MQEHCNLFDSINTMFGKYKTAIAGIQNELVYHHNLDSPDVQ